MASQCFYGLSIASDAQLPNLADSDDEWEPVLDRLVKLSYRTADKMLAHDAEGISIDFDPPKRKVKHGQ